MSNEWSVVTIDNVRAPRPASLAMGPFGSDIKSEYFVQHGVPVIRGGNLAADRFRDEDFVFISDDKADELRSANAYPGDLVFTHRGTLGQIGIIPHNARYPRYVVSQSQMKLTCDTAKADSLFVYYFFRSPAGQHALLANTSTTGVPAIARPLTSLRMIRLPLPPLTVQRAIAHILGTLDDKIDLNRRMNQTLEAIARTLFRSWFVDFDPVRAKAAGRRPEGMDAETAALFPSEFDKDKGIPNGWQVNPIGEAVTVVGGSTPSTVETAYWGGEFAFATPRDMSLLSSPILATTERRVTEKGLRQIQSGLLPKGTVLMSSRAPIGYLAIAETPVAVNQGIIAMICDLGLPNYYVLSWAQQNMDAIVGNANGTTFLEISKRNFRPLPVIVPSQPLLDRYVEVVRPLYERLTANLLQSRTLTGLRDALLPKLLSGEVRVPEAEHLM